MAFVALVSWFFIGCSTDDPVNHTSGIVLPGDNKNANPVTRPEYGRTEFPRLQGANSIVLVHKTTDTYDVDGVNFSVEWDVEKKSQRWCCYVMHKGFGGNAGYYGTFMEDPDLPVAARFDDTNAMYKGSGFTRGHICPSADRQYSTQANMQTFYYSNIQPQYYNFNAGKNYTGVWVVMENQLRQWTNRMAASDTLFVVKGGTITEGKILKKIKDELIVPAYFYVALLQKTPEGYKSLGLLFEHNDEVLSSVNLGDYVVSIRELELFTGIDFFCNLPDRVENALEQMTEAQMKNAWGLK